MQTNQLDFKGLASELLSRSLDLVSTWLPGGKVRGREYVCSGLSGGNGDSMSVNLMTGMWSDFANSDCAGGDLISLHAAVLGISNGESYKRLSNDQGFVPIDSPKDLPPPPPPAPKICQPPADAPQCDFNHAVYGEPAAFWTYLNAERKLLFYIVRYNMSDGKKQILPFTWSANGCWVNKGYPAPRPLYGLELLAERPNAPVLIVEGEKAADAARTLLGHTYVVVTWSNGSNAYRKAMWNAIYGRAILLWADADQVGIDAMHGIAELLKPHCPLIKTLTPVGMGDGFDAADALEEGWDSKKTVQWAMSCVSTYHTTAIAKPRKIVSEHTIVHGNAQIISKETHVHEAEEVVPLSETSIYWIQELGLPDNGKGVPMMNVLCVITVLERYPGWKDKFWFDVFEQKILTTWLGAVGSKPRELTDVDTIEMQCFMQSTFAMTKIGKETIYDGLVAVSNRRPRNAPKEYFESLVWDGMPRLNNFFTAYMSSDSSDYSEAVSKNFWIAMVARIYKPGCKMDNMVMLEGTQGKYKSTALGIIGGDWYAEAHGHVTDANFYYNIQGKLLIEFAELSNISNADANAIKKFASCPTDRYRAVWAKNARDFPRQCVCVGTTNEDEYLKDNTGARRFWPIKTHTIHIDKIEQDRDQLFAEAVVRYKARESWWEMPESAKEEQEKRRMTDEWEQAIIQYLMMTGKSEEVSTLEIITECLQIPIGRIDRLIERRVGSCLRLLGWEKFQIRKSSGRVYLWRNKIYYKEPEF